jgi:hypothetical protein
MASEVEICNLALGNIRAGSINSFTESSLQAQQCKLKYPYLRDMLLEDVPWNFAHKVDTLALLTDDLFNWVYAYQYPSDCLHINRLILNFEEFGDTGDGVTRTRHIEEIYTPDLDAQVKYEIQNVDGNRIIAANEPGLRVSYRKRITDPNLFSTLFIQTLSYLLASELAIPIVGGTDVGRQLRADSFKIYQAYLSEATASTKNEEYVEPRDSDFISSYK